MEYRCEATSVEGFVQQLAVSYVANGYWFYVTGLIPERKDARAVDAKLLHKYGIAVSKFARYRRKAAGRANVQYLRFGRFYILLATRGRHEIFGEERLKDCREEPIKFGSYSIGYRDGHSHVGIERGTYRDLKAYLLGLAAHRSREWLAGVFSSLPFEPYAPVRRQLVTLFNRVNGVRVVAGLDLLSMDCLRLRRRICRPFGYERKCEAA